MSCLYARAKKIVKPKYGRPSEVVTAHIQVVMGLAFITEQTQQESVHSMRSYMYNGRQKC